MSMDVTRETVTTIKVKTQTGNGHRVTVDHLMWMSRQLQPAIDAGMPLDTEVKIDNPSSASGVTMTATATLRREIP